MGSLIASSRWDIEGGEYHALCGARDAMTRHRPFIVVESGRSGHAELYDYSMEDWCGLFASAGYKVFDLFGRPFTRENWTYRDEDGIPWYFIAAPDGPEAEAFLQGLPGVIDAAYKRRES
jgi:hypothetical protein